jgi:hypothetical protein
MSRTIVLAALAAATLALGASQARAHSDPTAVEDLAGHYQGFFQSSVSGGIGTFTLDLTASHNRQLDGILMSPILPAALPFHVTVAASGEFTAVSLGSLVVHGRPDSAFIRFEQGDYKLRMGGMTDVGTLSFIQSFPPNPATVQLPAVMAGTFTRHDDGSTGRITVDLRDPTTGMSTQKGSDFHGTAMFGDMPFPFQGSIGAPDDAGLAPVRALSVSPFGTLLITGVWDTAAPQPHMNGLVSATLADGSVFTADFTLLVPAINPPPTNAD